MPPADAEIASDIALISTGSITDLPRSTDFVVADESILEEYVRRTAELGSTPAPISFVYSAMH